MRKIPYLLIVLISFSIKLNAQNEDFSNYGYDFIRTDKNKIEFPADSSNFENLFFKLDRLIKTGEGKINIVHIGGSHIQSGFYTSVVRKKMQTFFPGLNAGRGLLFPFKMANTNYPKNYSFNWTGNWETCRNVEKKDCSLGLTGISATTHDKNSIIELKLNPNYLNYDFNRILIFNETNNQSFKIEPLNIIGDFKITEYPEKDYTEIITKNYQSEFTFKIIKTDSLQNFFSLYGIYTDNDNSGIIYNDAGINGAGISSFLKCNLLETQIEILNPDLIILSLGTNDTYTQNFNSATYKSTYKELIHKIKNAVPDAAILITVPNDSYYRRKYPNANTALAEECIYELAKEKACGIWNFYQVMGAYNSSFLWHKEKLMQNDLIHMTTSGYNIKGNLMFDALLKAYDRHIDETPM